MMLRTIIASRGICTSARLNNSIKECLRDGLKQSMKSKDSNTSTVIRSLLSEIAYSEKETPDLDENKTIKLVQKAIIRRKESAEQYLQAKRQDLADKENFDISVLEKYIPKPFTQEEMVELINNILNEAKLNVSELDGRAMGQVIKDFTAKAAGRASGGDASKLIKQMQKK
ncbi:GatB/YqeY domain-containing protein [Wallemia mellicola]|uniref:Altered inheritance of mitochondria protein 41 n=1 Tax=Wallemia mellicola TaxID=1708541 RepID=A0A4T0R6U2_9BASI|nr:GatB/YqeY domain-containing protein [Wallemia mellicola]